MRVALLPRQRHSRQGRLWTPRIPPVVDPVAAVAASRVAADSFWSQALGIRKQFVVYLPPSYEASGQRRYPVAYYLHGMWGDEWNWVRAGGIDHTLDSLVTAGMPEMIVVMPDGDDGWYTTWNNLGNNAECRRAKPPGRQTETVESYCVPWPKYDDYIARDLVARVDSIYRTIPSRIGPRDRRAEHGRIRCHLARARVSGRVLRRREPFGRAVTALHGSAPVRDIAALCIERSGAASRTPARSLAVDGPRVRTRHHGLVATRSRADARRATSPPSDRACRR